MFLCRFLASGPQSYIFHAAARNLCTCSVLRSAWVAGRCHAPSRTPVTRTTQQALTFGRHAFWILIVLRSVFRIPPNFRMLLLCLSFYPSTASPTCCFLPRLAGRPIRCLPRPAVFCWLKMWLIPVQHPDNNLPIVFPYTAPASTCTSRLFASRKGSPLDYQHPCRSV